MSEGNNGFEDMAKMLGKMDIGKDIADDGLKQAADAFTEWVRPKVPVDDHSHNKGKYGHMRDQLKVIRVTGGFDVTFGNAYWWIFAENGTGGKHPQRAQNFVHGTFEQRWGALEQMLQNAALKKIMK